MSMKQIAGALVAATLAVPTVALSATDASAKGLRVRTSGSCTASTDWKLKAKQDDGRLEVEFEVDSNRNRQTWKVTISDNGNQAWAGTRRTKAPSGSFSVEKRIPNLAGADVIVATARNTRSGETCTGTLTFPG